MPNCPQGHTLQTPGAYCQTCAKCQLCTKPLTVAEYEWCVRRNAVNLKEDASAVPVFEHPACLNQVEKESLASETVTLPRSVYDKLNAYRLLIEPNLSWGLDTNQQDARYCAERLAHTLTVEETVFVLARAESMCAALTLATRKDRKSIEIRIKDRQKTDFAAASAARQAPKTPKVVAKVERKQLSKEDKAINALMNIGLSESEAREQVNSRKAG